MSALFPHEPEADRGSGAATGPAGGLGRLDAGPRAGVAGAADPSPMRTSETPAVGSRRTAGTRRPPPREPRRRRSWTRKSPGRVYPARAKA